MKRASLIGGMAVLLCGLGQASLSSADIFSFSAENGSVSLSNYPTDGRYTLLLASPAKQPQQVSSSTNATPAAPPSAALSFAPLVNEAAQANTLDAALLHAVITAESGYQPDAVSPKGARGLMQLMPETAKRYGVSNLNDPAQNISGGARYLKDLLKMFDNDLPLTLAAYNAGENAVFRYGRKIPPYRETANYVKKVLELYTDYQVIK